jgi:hypothetical protein
MATRIALEITTDFNIWHLKEGIHQGLSGTFNFGSVALPLHDTNHIL